jgi:hypothetical protein
MMEWNDPPPSDQRDVPSVAAQTRILQIIVGALILGVLAFAGFVVATQLNNAPRQTGIATIACGFAALNIVLHFVVPAFIERTALNNLSVDAGSESLLGVFFTRTIIACALLEGAAFLSIFAVMSEQKHWMFGVTAVLLALMLMQFPTRTRIEHWLELRMMEREQGT